MSEISIVLSKNLDLQLTGTSGTLQTIDAEQN